MQLALDPLESESVFVAISSDIFNENSIEYWTNFCGLSPATVLLRKRSEHSADTFAESYCNVLSVQNLEMWRDGDQMLCLEDVLKEVFSRW